jgi:hypothetical protein
MNIQTNKQKIKKNQKCKNADGNGLCTVMSIKHA